MISLLAVLGCKESFVTNTGTDLSVLSSEQNLMSSSSVDPADSVPGTTPNISSSEYPEPKYSVTPIYSSDYGTGISSNDTLALISSSSEDEGDSNDSSQKGNSSEEELSSDTPPISSSYIEKGVLTLEIVTCDDSNTFAPKSAVSEDTDPLPFSECGTPADDYASISLTEPVVGGDPEDVYMEIDVVLDWGTELYTWDTEGDVQIDSISPIKYRVRYLVGSATFRAVIRVLYDGSFIDSVSTEGFSYRWTRIGDQIWMQDNLIRKNVDHRSFAKASETHLYGLLYDWDMAQTICPDGWRLPTDRDWMDLEMAVTGVKTYAEIPYSYGNRVKSEDGWYKEQAGLGIETNLNITGHGTYYKVHGEVQDKGFQRVGDYWTATETITEPTKAWYKRFHGGTSEVETLSDPKSYFKAVRCLLK